MSRFAQIAGLALSAVAAAAASASARFPASSEPRAPVPLSELKDFDGVSLGGPDTLLVTSGQDYAVAVEGDPQALEKLDIYVENHVLHVERRWRRGETWSDDDGATVRVTLPELRRVSLRGSGDIRIDRMAGDHVEVALAGSGDVVIGDVAAQEAALSLAGSGTLTVRGKVQNTRVSIAGSGDVHADQLTAAWTNVSIAGSGDAFVHASEGARVSIVGSGDALVRGTTNCRSSRMGSGDVHCSV